MFIYWIMREIMRIPQPKITRAEAVEIAGRCCKERGWTMKNPSVVEELRTWLVWTAGGMKPSPFVAIDQQTGDVVESGCAPY